MLLSYQHRLYPTPTQAAQLDAMLESHRLLYNAALQERKEAWKRRRISIRYEDQAVQLKALRQEDPIGQWSHTTAQQVLRRVQHAFNAFFRRLKENGERKTQAKKRTKQSPSSPGQPRRPGKPRKPGYPRFKSKRAFSSVLCIFGDGATLTKKTNRLGLTGLKTPIKVKWHRPLPEGATIKTVSVKRDGFGKWFACFQVEVPDPAPQVHPGPMVGLDLGLHSLVALSTGETIPAPQHYRKAERTLRVQQRRCSRRTLGSNRWRKACRARAKTEHHVGRQRKDFAHKLSTRLTESFSVIAIEHLDVQALAQSMLAKSIHDAAWAQFRDMLAYKAARAGGRCIPVNPRGTTQLCSTPDCGSVVIKDLASRVHRCPICGLVLDRDVNAARNVLARALETLGLSVRNLTWAMAPCVFREALNLG